jgi:6-phosphogluconate dehydrogenase
VDEFIEHLLPLLEPGDIIIDGGNSLFEDTNRRVKYVESKGLLYIGTGVSGGEEGARHGPSIMPGGSPAAWPHVKDIFQGVSAKVDGASRAATGSAKAARVITSRWFTTASNTATCS